MHKTDDKRVERDYNKALVFNYCPTTLNSDMAAVKMEKNNTEAYAFTLLYLSSLITPPSSL